jgi:hypothetical protein
MPRKQQTDKAREAMNKRPAAAVVMEICPQAGFQQRIVKK